MRRTIVAFALWTLIMPHIGAAQPTCPPVVSDLSHTATLSVTNPSNTCTATDGDSIKTNTTYRLHVNAAVAGSCQTYTWQGGCIPAWLYKHTAVRTDQSVTSYPTTLTVLGALNVQSYNTCTNINPVPPANCTSVGTLQTGSSWMAPTPALYVYSAENVAGGGTTGPGQCNMTHFYPSANSITLHALACIPQWRVDPTTNNIIHVPNPTTVNVYIPPTIPTDSPVDLAVRAAITAWNQANAANGISVNLAPTTDLCSGPSCIRVATGPTGFACASISIPQTAGTPINTMNLTIRSSWTPEMYKNGALTQSVSHELGHFFGLADNSCVQDNSVMAPPTACELGKMLTTPPYTDSHPVANTVYGGGSRNSCQ